MKVEEAGRLLATPAAFADEATLYEGMSLLRREAPVCWVEPTDYRPFWAVTRHADVVRISRDSQHFLNGPRPLLQPLELEEAGNARPFRTLIDMDDPDHRAHRKLTAEWFQGPSLRRLEPRIRALAREYVDRMRELGDRCDFASEVAAWYPLRVIMSILGVLPADEPHLLRLTQELFGSTDPELSRGKQDELENTVADFAAYFMKLTQSRRDTPTDDLASVIANGRIDGEPLGDLETFSYYVIVATAGHDTTSSSTAGGIYALLRNPDQWERLVESPELLETAVDETIRWVTPVKHFIRTATEDCELRGQKIRAGDSLLLCYPSANRDAEVFEEPDRFDVGRSPNPHVSFGFGAHFCLGAKLARMEISALYRELLDRAERIELDGDPAWVESVFVSGLKHLPIRVHWKD